MPHVIYETYFFSTKKVSNAEIRWERQGVWFLIGKAHDSKLIHTVRPQGRKRF